MTKADALLRIVDRVYAAPRSASPMMRVLRSKVERGYSVSRVMRFMAKHLILEAWEGGGTHVSLSLFAVHLLHASEELYPELMAMLPDSDDFFKYAERLVADADIPTHGSSESFPLCVAALFVAADAVESLERRIAN